MLIRMCLISFAFNFCYHYTNKNIWNFQLCRQFQISIPYPISRGQTHNQEAAFSLSEKWLLLSDHKDSINVALLCLYLHTAAPSTDPSFCSPEGREAMPHENCVYRPKRFQKPNNHSVLTISDAQYVRPEGNTLSTAQLFVTRRVPTATRHPWQSTRRP